MSKFAKYRKFYKEPERYAPDIARERRLASRLERERQQVEALSLAQRERFKPAWKVDEDRSLVGPKDNMRLSAALAMFQESDFVDPAKRKEYRRLRAIQEQQRAKPAGADRRQYTPYPTVDFASTVFGTAARFGAVVGRHAVPKFRMAYAVIPCIERLVRREVLFAKGKGGKGYHTRKRRSWASGVPC